MPSLARQKNSDHWFDPDVILFASAGQARKHFADVINSAQSGDNVVITKHGRPVAAVVSVRDFRIIQLIQSAGLSDQLLKMAKKHEMSLLPK